MRIRVLIAVILILLSSAPGASALVITEGYTTDFIVLYTCGYYLSIDRHPNTLGTFAAPQWALLVDNEPVYVIAHGGQGTIGTMNGAQLAAWIAAPAWFTTPIYTTSCESAIGSTRDPSLITAAANASVRTRSFTGYAGCAIADAAGAGVRVVLPAKVGTMAQIQVALMQQLAPQNQIAQFVAQYQAAHGGANPPLVLLAQYAYGNQVIQQFYADLLVAGQRQGCLYQAGQGSVTKQGKL